MIERLLALGRWALACGLSLRMIAAELGRAPLPAAASGHAVGSSTATASSGPTGGG